MGCPPHVGYLRVEQSLAQLYKPPQEQQEEQQSYDREWNYQQQDLYNALSEQYHFVQFCDFVFLLEVFELCSRSRLRVWELRLVLLFFTALLR